MDTIYHENLVCRNDSAGGNLGVETEKKKIIMKKNMIRLNDCSIAAN